MMALARVAKVGEIPDGEIRGFELNGKPVAIANQGGKFYALNGTCPHRGGPLGEGTLEGNLLTCPWHGWQFEVATGKNAIGGAGAACFHVEVRWDEVLVDVE